VRGQDPGAPNGCGADGSRGNIRRSPAIALGASPGLSQTTWQRDSLERDSRSGAPHVTDVNHSSSSLGQKLRSRSPSVLVTGASPAAAAFVANVSGLFGGKAVSAAPALSVASIPIASAVNAPAVNAVINRSVVSPFGQATASPILAGLSVPPHLQLSDALASNILNAAGLKAGISAQWSALLSGGLSDAGPVPVTAAAATEEESPPAATGWKKKKVSQEYVSLPCCYRMHLFIYESC
jgi:hypothetical protein